MNPTPPKLAAAAVALLLCGCASQPEAGPGLTDELTHAKAQIIDLQQENSELKSQLEQRRRQVETLQALGDKRLEKMFKVTGIKLGRHSGPVDLDDVGGSDAVRVYLKPVDQYGSVIKAAGDVRVRLFDLAAERQNTLIGEYEWPVDEVAERWSGGFATDHFTFDCPLAEPAKLGPITIHAEFTDYLTGNTFSAQTACDAPTAR